MPFKVSLFYHQGSKHQLIHHEAFRKGLLRHGVNVSRCEDGERIDCDIAVFWGHRRDAIIAYQKKKGRDYIVLERGYVGDRFSFTSIAFNGLNNRADFVVEDMPGDRWGKYFSGKMQPWEAGGNYLLIAGQVQGDASVKPYIDYRYWVSELVVKIKCVCDLPIVFRPHPIDIQRFCEYEVKGTKKSKNSCLKKDMGNAKAVITFNSNAGCDAILAGVPVVTFDRGSMVYDLSTHGLDDDFIRPDRTKWAHDIAYKQWTLAEMEAGEPWEYLRQKKDRNYA